MKPKVNKPEDKNTAVAKALSDEEATIVSNIQSQLNQLMQMAGGEQVVTEAAVTENGEDKNEDIDNMDGKPKEDKEVKLTVVDKGLETTNSDSSTASDDAKERMDEVQTELSEDSVSEVAKAILHGLQNLNKAKVKKSVNPVVSTMETQNNVLKQLADNQAVLGNTLAKLFDGMGLTQQLQIAEKSLPKKETNPIVSKDNSAATIKFMQEIVGAVNKSKEPKVDENKNLSQSSIVNKNLANANVLAGLVGKTIPVRNDKF